MLSVVNFGKSFIMKRSGAGEIPGKVKKKTWETVRMSVIIIEPFNFALLHAVEKGILFKNVRKNRCKWKTVNKTRRVLLHSKNYQIIRKLVFRNQ